MVKLTDEMKDYINKGLCVVATADASGIPNVSFRGTLQVLDDEHLVFADIFAKKTRKNLMENKQVCLLVGDHSKKVGYQLVGEAELFDHGDIFENMCKKIEAFNLPKPTYAVKIKVNHVYPMNFSL